MNEDMTGGDPAAGVVDRLRAVGDAPPSSFADFDELWRQGRRQRLALGTAGVGATAAVIAVAALGLAELGEGPVGRPDVAAAGSTCPVTVPSDDFVPPAPWPATPATNHVGATDATAHWYGSADLWTVLPSSPDGYAPQRKSVWWSEHFEGGAVEETPQITVQWRRLDDPSAEPLTEGPGTNARTGADGWFMIVGVDPHEPGCWEVTADYRGHQLTYVYEVR